jgi:elongation factor Ts
MWLRNTFNRSLGNNYSPRFSIGYKTPFSTQNFSPQLNSLYNHKRRNYTTSSPEPSLLDLVKILRKDTSAGIADCRQALIECDRDISKAKDWLFKKSKKIAAKKSDRGAYEGGIIVVVDNAHAVILEINCETDFAAKESNFTSVARTIATAYLNHAKEGNDCFNILNIPCKTTVAGISVNHPDECIEVLAGILKENVKLRRVNYLPSSRQDNDNIRFKSYVHGSLDNKTPPIGRIGVLLQYSNPSLAPEHEKLLQKFVHNICVQIATQPVQYLYPFQVPSISKPDPVSNPDGVEEQHPVLMKQDYLFGSGTVASAIQEFEDKYKTKLTLQDFRRWVVSEGEEKVEGNLASEVEELLKATKPNKRDLLF